MADKCFYCKNELGQDVVEKKVPYEDARGIVRKYTRKFHSDCSVKFFEELDGANYKATRPKVKKTMEARCYYCKLLFDKGEKVKTIQIVVNGRPIDKQFHNDCILPFFSKIGDEEIKGEENSWFIKTCEYIKSEIMGLPANDDVNKALNKHIAMRVKGSRVGKFYPNHENTIAVKGYDYEAIYYACKFSKQTLVDMFARKSFDNDIGKANYAFAVINKYVPKMQERLISKRKQEKMVSRVDLKSTQNVQMEFKSRNKNKSKGKKKFAWLED